MAFARLKEISSDDLKQFSGNLRHLWLFYNDIEVIEENLFMHNPNLWFIELASNKIAHVDAKVFDNLRNLNTLRLHENPCTKSIFSESQAWDNRSAVLSIIPKIVSRCQDPKYAATTLPTPTITTERSIFESTTTTTETPNIPELEAEISILKSILNTKNEEIKKLRAENEKCEKKLLEKFEEQEKKLASLEAKFDDLKKYQEKQFLSVEEKLLEKCDSSEKFSKIEAEIAKLPSTVVEGSKVQCDGIRRKLSELEGKFESTSKFLGAKVEEVCLPN